MPFFLSSLSKVALKKLDDIMRMLNRIRRLINGTAYKLELVDIQIARVSEKSEKKIWLKKSDRIAHKKITSQQLNPLRLMMCKHS